MSDRTSAPDVESKNVDELRRRLAEAEETLDAIRRGEVDAVVVQGPAGPHVYALRSADHAYRMLVEQMNEGALALTPSGTIVYANKRFASIIDYPLEQIIAHEFSSFLSLESREPVRSLLTTLPGKFEGFLAGRRRDVPVSFASASVEVNGEPGVVLVVTDLTEQKRREAAMNAEKLLRMALEDANRAKNEFLITVSHELRTPLTSILGWATLLRRPDLDSETREIGLESIEQSARVQTALIEDLLDVSRIVTGKVRLVLEPIDLAHSLETAIATIRGSAESKHIRIALSVQPDLPRVRGDATRLQQVFWNLLTNALKFTPEGGRVEVSASASESHVRVDVRDNGCGIPDEFVPRAFDRFTQADASAVREHGGLGLGLSIVRDLVQLHGGSVSAMPNGEGTGSVFTVELPAFTGMPATVRQPVIAGELPLKGMTVLAVDDDAPTRVWLTRTLEIFGASVLSAASVADAFAVLHAVKPDVVISDLAMPVEDGLAFVTRLRMREEGRSVATIALTAFGRAEDRDRSIAAGFDEYLMKPIEATQLVRAVHDVHERKSAANRPVPVSAPA